MHYLDDSKALIRRQLGIPCCLKFILNIGAFNLLIARINIGQSTHITGTLNVILSAKRIYTGRFLADMPCHHRKVRKAKNIVRPRRVLGDSHAVDDRRRFCPGISYRSLTDKIGRDGCYLRRFLKRNIFNRFLKQLKILGSLGDKILIEKVFVDDNFYHCVYQGNISARLLCDMHIGKTYKIDTTGIGDDELRTVINDRVLYVQSDNRMGLGGIRSYHKNTLSVFKLFDGVCHRPAAERLGQTGNRRRMTKPCAMIYIICPDTRTHKLLEDIVFLVRTLCRRKTCNAVRTVYLFYRTKSRSKQIQSFVP